MNETPTIWRILKVWTRRRPGMKMVISHADSYNGVWIRPDFKNGNHDETRNMWVNVDTGETLVHFSYIPHNAIIREYCSPPPKQLQRN